MLSMQAADAGCSERRRHPRYAVSRAAKVRRTTGLPYCVAATVNVSSSGALVSTGSSGAFCVGDEIELVVAWEGEAVLPRASGVCGVVRRVVPAGEGAEIGVQFARPCGWQAAGRAAA